MLDQRYRGLADAAEDAARQPEFATVQRRAERLRTRRRAVSVVAAAILAISSATGLAVVQATVGSPQHAASGDGQLVRWSGAADANHLYAVVDECVFCPQRLIASEDGGRTWEQRGASRTWVPGPALTVVGPEILIEIPNRRLRDLSTATSGDSSSRSLSQAMPPVVKISVDGGRTWKDLDVATTPVAAVPAGTRAVDCTEVGRTDPCRVVYAVDPSTGRIAPLAVQPPLERPELADAPPTAGVWVQGLDPTTGRPAMAVSHDAGRTWTAATFSAEPADVERVPLNVTTTDGTVAYALIGGGPGAVHVYRSNDGGVQWRRVDDGQPMPMPLAGPSSMVAGDGTHVVAAIDSSGFQYLASPDGKSYRRADLTGLPSLGHVPRAISGDSFLVHGEDALYVSSDGWTWRRVPLG